MKINMFIKNKISEEIIITLHDNNKKMIIKTNKQILNDRLTYFKNTFSFKENTLQYFEIEVPNAHVVYDIILSCKNPNWNTNALPQYNIGNLPKYHYILEYWKCCDFLCLPFCQQLLFDFDNLTIENYDLLVDTIDFFGYDKYKIWLMNKFLPLNYDLSKFPKELIKKMIKYAINYMFIEETKICFCCSPKKLYDFKLSDNDQKGQIINVSRDFKKIVTITENFVKVWDLKSGKILYTKEEKSGIKCVDFTHNSDILVIVYQKRLKLFSIVDDSYVRNLCYPDDIIAFTCSPNGEYFSVVTSDAYYEKFSDQIIFAQPRHLEIYESISLRRVFVSHFISSNEILNLPVQGHLQFFSKDSTKITLNVYHRDKHCTNTIIKKISGNIQLDNIWISDNQIGICILNANYSYYTISDSEWMFMMGDTIYIFDFIKRLTTIKFTIPNKESDESIKILQHIHKYIIVVLHGNKHEIWNIKKGKLLYSNNEWFRIMRKDNLGLKIHLGKFLYNAYCIAK